MRHSDIKSRFHFVSGLRFEIFFALQALTDKRFRIHRRWRERTLVRMPPAFTREFRTLGSAPTVWPIVADTLNSLPVDSDFRSILLALRRQDVSVFQREVLLGAIHYRDIVERLLRNKSTLAEALSKTPAVKREWLAFIGLYPYQPGREMVAAMESLLRSPGYFKTAVISMLELFWKHSFEDGWRMLQTRFAKSAEEKERLFGTCTFQEFARQALLRIEVDERERSLNALRGGARLPFDRISKGYIFPSAFNDKRYWTTFKKGGRSVAFFPYFEPALASLLTPAAGKALAAPEPDPYLIFKALGDPTRAAIAEMIAGAPANSVSIADALKLSKPLVCHHVHVLREAGVLAEMRANGCNFLSLKRDVLENLSRLAVARFFGNDKGKRRPI